jgi:hypothetical protein
MLCACGLIRDKRGIARTETAEHRSCEIYSVGSRYHATGEDTGGEGEGVEKD